MALSLEDFIAIREMVYAESGIFFKEEKMYFVETRLQARLQAINCVEPTEYIRFLKYDKSKAELDQFIDSLTTNETYFFRDLYQIDAFADEVLPYLLEKKAKENNRTLRIWSAGCSTGEEAYTIAMIMLEKIKDFSSWKIQIIANDISQRVLAACRAGVYPPRALKDTPDLYKNRYFTKTDHTYKVSFELKKLIQFCRINLSNRPMMRTLTNIDCILCRNVLIYFNEESAKKVVNTFYDNLNPGGIVFLGHSESMHRFSAAFKMVKYQKAFAYVKE